MSLLSCPRSALRLAGALAVTFALGAIAGPAVARGSGIVSWKDANGVTHYTNVPGEAKRAQSAAEAEPSVTALTARDMRAHSAVFKFKDATGVTHYTDKRPVGRSYLVINVYCPACDPRSPVNWDRTKLNLTAYTDSIQASATEYGVDPALVRAIIHAESAFNPQAMSRKGAQGLMQLMPGTASQYGVSNPYDASENIRAGVRHLASLLKSYNGDVKLAAAAYNAGQGAVQKYGGVPPYEETRLYVQRVGTLHKRYQVGS